MDDELSALFQETAAASSRSQDHETLSDDADLSELFQESAFAFASRKDDDGDGAHESDVAQGPGQQEQLPLLQQHKQQQKRRPGRPPGTFGSKEMRARMREATQGLGREPDSEMTSLEKARSVVQEERQADGCSRTGCSLAG